MSFRSLVLRRFAVSLAAILVVSACSEDGRKAPLSEVETVDIPAADVDNQNNQNINNPTLNMPATFEVSDGDLLTLVWNDEFDGAQLDPQVWFYETGDGSQYGFGQGNIPAGWGNNELEYYLPDNAQLVNGVLEITARRESAEGFNFTSARINTRDRFAFKYGRIEARIKLPSGQGLWPAFWLLSQDSPYGGWAATGEIDVLEAVNLDGTGGNEIFSSIHFGGEESLGQNTSTSTTYTPSFDVTEDFHTYAFEWDEFEMRWYVDGTLTMVENSWFSTAAPYPAPFDQPFYVLFNLAVGGDFPGSPNGTTPLPATMEVDWVRVYSGEEPPAVPADPGTIPDVVLFASDPSVTVDLVIGVDYTSLDPFDSGSVFDTTFAGDADFSPAFAVTTGNGYGAQVGQLGILGFAAGFATGYGTLDFKAKGLNGNLIRVKFLDDPNYLDINLASSSYSTALGNGWYQVSVPIADFTGVATATGLLFETNDLSPGPFTFLLTDLGFSVSTGGGGTGLGVFSETNTATVVNITNIVSAGNPVAIDSASTAVAPFDGAVSLELMYSDNTQNNFFGGAIFEFDDADLSSYDTLKFSIDTSAFAGFANLTVQLEPPGGGTPGGNVSLAGYTPVATSGNWNTYEIPLADFTAANLSLVNRLGFFNARDGGDALLAGTLYLDDIHFTTVGGSTGGGGGDGTFVNGDFESGDFTGWTLTQVPNDRGSIALDSSGQGGRAGNVARLVSAGDATGTNDVLISQVALAAGTVAPGDSIDVSFDLYGSLSGAGGVVFVEVIFLNGAGQDEGGRNFVGPAAPYVPSTTWTTHSGTVIAGTAGNGSQWDVSGGVTLELKAACGAIAGGCGVDASFDNVTFTIN